MQCEMCGTEAELKRTRVEGAVLKLCEDCQETGEVLETGTSSRKRKDRKKRDRKPRGQQRELIPDFGKVVKQAREERDLSMEELASRINEKESVVQRIETGKLKPDKDLSRKLKKHLGVDLYVSASDVSYKKQRRSDDSGGATIGDIADIKKRS